MFAIPFDLDKLETTGRSVPIIEGVRRGSGRAGATGLAHLAFSNTGSLVYVPAPPGGEQGDLVLFDRKGGTVPLKLPPGQYQFPRVSPDGSRIAFETTDRSETVISTYEMSGAGSIRRLTFVGSNRFPLWSPDGRRLAFQSDRDGDQALFWQPAESGNAQRLTKPERGTSHVAESWSPDGQVLLFSEKKDQDYSLWTFSLRDGKATLFERVQGSRLPTNASFSPDGRWVAYQIGQVGTPEGTDLRAALPTDGDQAPDRTRRPPAVVPRRQGALLHPGARAVSGSNCEHSSELYVHQARCRAARVRGCPSRASAAVQRPCRTAGSSASAYQTRAPAGRRFTSSSTGSRS